MKLLGVFFLIYFCIDGISQQAETVFNQGVNELNEGNYFLADSLITRAIFYDKGHGKKDYLKFYNRGLAREYMDSVHIAIRDFDTSISLNPNFYLSYQERSVCYYTYSEDSLALRDINSALKLNPNDLESYIVKVLVELNLRNYNSIIVTCNKALTLKNDPRFYCYRSISNSFLEKFSLAKKDIDIGFELFPSNIDISEAEVFYLYKTKNSLFCEKHKSLITIQPDFFYSIFDQHFSDELKKCK